MFDTRSDYALNKRKKSAIVCKSVTGTHIELTSADFSSETEFLKWKNWSDKDYAKTEAAGYEDDCCYIVGSPQLQENIFHQKPS